MNYYTNSNNEEITDPGIGVMIVVIVMVTLFAAGIAFGSMELNTDRGGDGNTYGAVVTGNQKKSCFTSVSDQWDTDIIEVTGEREIKILLNDTTYIKVKILHKTSDSLETKFDNEFYD